MTTDIGCKEDGKILIVSGNPDQIPIKTNKYGIDTAKSNNEAGALCQQSKYCMLIIDMPSQQDMVLQREQLIQEIAGKNPGQEMLLILNPDQQADLETILKQRCTIDYLLRPIDEMYLLHRLEIAHLISRKNNALERRERVLRGLAEFGQSIGNLTSSDTSLEDKLSVLGNETGKVMGASICAIYLNKGDYLEIIGKGDKQANVNIPLKKIGSNSVANPIYDAINTKKTVIILENSMQNECLQRSNNCEAGTGNALPDNKIIIPLYNPKNDNLGLMGVVELSGVQNLKNDNTTKTKCGIIQGIISTTLNNILQYQMLLEISIRDPYLSSLYNKRHFKERLEDEVIRAHRTKTPLSLIIGDIDHFKDINDNYGHGVGDYVLQKVSEQYIKAIRKGMDIAGRDGGEEFGIILPYTTIEQAFTVADRLRAAIKETKMDIKEMPQDKYEEVRQAICGKGLGEIVSVKSSFGVAQLESGWTADRLKEKADQCLYQAKSHGRNMVYRNQN